MQCLKTKKFQKQENGIQDQQLLNLFLNAIDNIENAETIIDISNLKKMKGYNNAYRIKIKNYRLCFYLNENIIELEKFEHRKDAYNDFP
jgi:mRNA interferase RelE/StbE